VFGPEKLFAASGCGCKAKTNPEKPVGDKISSFLIGVRENFCLAGLLFFLGARKMARKSGKKILAESIKALGIGRVFTVRAPGLDELVEVLEQESGAQVFFAHDEVAATLMADGFVRRSRKSAAVLTGSWGRALAQVAGVTNAWADRVPLLSISLCSDDGPDNNKGWNRADFDQGAVFAPVVRWRGRISLPEQIPKALAKAVIASRAGRMGPAHLDICPGALQGSADEKVLACLPPVADPDAVIEPARIPAESKAVSRAAALIKNAKKPLIFAGGGVKSSAASAVLEAFAQALGIPVATSMSGIGAISSDSPFCIGAPSYTAGETFHAAIREADVVLAVGAAFSGLEGFGLPPIWSADISFIHVDNDPLVFGVNVSPQVSVLGDVRTVLTQIHQALAKSGFDAPAAWKPWHEYLMRLKGGRKKRLADFALKNWAKPHQGRLALDLARFMVEQDAIMVIDGGNTPLYAASYAPGLAPDQAFFPFGMAALGGGVPYSVGVALAAKGRRVMLVTGDGSFLYAVQELETIRRLDLPVTIFVNNDSAWNMIKAMQDSFFECRYVGTCIPETDYAKIAKGFGIPAMRVTKAAQMDKALEFAAGHSGPVLVDCVTDCKNLPDSLLSFTLVEFEGSLTQLDPKKVLKSLWMNRSMGLARSRHMADYVRKAILGINPSEKRGL
jgi:acetolactate synthase-1/2/3 large subunit